MMLVLSRVPSLAMAVVLIHCVLSWPSVVKKYAAANDWHLVKVPYREALRIKPEDGYLASNLVYYRVTRMVERATAPGSTVYTFRPIPEAYMSRNLLVAYQSEENIISQRILFTGFVTEYAPVWRYRFTFPRQPVKALRIVQSNTTPDIWTMHELRVFDGTREWVRGQWQMTARPDPWRLRNLLDDNLMTSWICEDTLQPGQFVEADFPRPEQADSVRVETSPNQWGIRVSLHGQDPAGAWHPLATQPEYLPNAPTPPDLRRMATAELKRRGIDYVLFFDDEFGADDFQKNAVLWGVRQVGEEQGARLYQLP
jgi:hypothetical protein